VIDWLQVLIGLLSGGVLAAIVANYVAVRRLQPEINKLKAEAKATEANAEKADAETAEIIGRTWAGIVKELKDDLEKARGEIASLRAAQAAMAVQIEERDRQRDKDRRLIRVLQKQVAALRAQLVELGHEPYKVTNGDTEAE
jgi:chromosome segregation ATPase